MKSTVLLALAAVVTCAQGPPTPASKTPTLKEAYAGLFRIGAALNQAQFEERDERAKTIVAAQFNTISPENHLKWGLIHPRPDGYNFEPADRYVAFGEKHKMFIVG